MSLKIHFQTVIKP